MSNNAAFGDVLPPLFLSSSALPVPLVVLLIGGSMIVGGALGALGSEISGMVAAGVAGLIFIGGLVSGTFSGALTSIAMLMFTVLNIQVILEKEKPLPAVLKGVLWGAPLAAVATTFAPIIANTPLLSEVIVTSGIVAEFVIAKLTINAYKSLKASKAKLVEPQEKAAVPKVRVDVLAEVV
jgi:hypothetical protein